MLNFLMPVRASAQCALQHVPQIAILCTFQIKTVNFILDPPLIETIKWDIPLRISYKIIILPFKQFELIEQQ